MSEWILILTFIYGEGVTISQVGGFSDVKQCQAAAAAWRLSINDWYVSRQSATAACVLRTGAKALPSKVE
jgi:hypothetical protein